jgi:hypothetical protein
MRRNNLALIGTLAALIIVTGWLWLAGISPFGSRIVDLAFIIVGAIVARVAERNILGDD